MPGKSGRLRIQAQREEVGLGMMRGTSFERRKIEKIMCIDMWFAR